MSVRRLTEEELRQVQLLQLEMLCEVDRICALHKIRYNIIAGTLLGAVRHGGYIPWDDDADVAFLREEYEKFREACERDLDRERFCFQDHRNTPGYRWGYGKLRRRGSLFLRQHQEHMPYEQGVFIDLFPLDPVSDSRWVRALQNVHCFCLRKLMWAPVGRLACARPGQRRLYRLLEKLPPSWLYGYYDWYVRRRNRKASGWVRILTFPTPNREYGYRRQWYEQQKQIFFEGKPFWSIQDWDSYLSFKFGNYMELPPQENRKVHPVTGFRLPEGEE